MQECSDKRKGRAKARPFLQAFHIIVLAVLFTGDDLTAEHDIIHAAAFGESALFCGFLIRVGFPQLLRFLLLLVEELREIRKSLLNFEIPVPFICLKYRKYSHQDDDQGYQRNADIPRIEKQIKQK